MRQSAHVFKGWVVTDQAGPALAQYSSCGTNSWLGDRLGSNEVIGPGASRFFDMYDGIRQCCRDMRAKFVNGATRSRMSVDVCRESQWVVR